MSRLRRDPRAEAARHAVPGGVRPRSTIEVAATTAASGRPRRDPRAELAALLVAAPRRRLDRSLAGAAGPANLPATAASALAAAAVAGPASLGPAAVPAIRTVASPAFHVLVVPDAATGRVTAHDRQLLGAARLLADTGGGAVVVAADGGEWGMLGADRVLSTIVDDVAPIPQHATQPSPLAGEGREGGRPEFDVAFAATPLPTLPLRGGGLPPATVVALGEETPCDSHASAPAEARAHDPARRTAAVVAAIRAVSPRHVLFAETADGCDLARRVAAALGEPLFAGAESITARSVTRPARAGRIEQRAVPPRLISVLADVVAPHAGPPHEARSVTLADLAAERPPESGTGDRPPAPAGDGWRIASLPRGILSAETIPADPAVVPLAEASFVVSAGNGVTDFDAFRALVAALSATPGASRVVCDAGLMPRDRQVGASGTVLDATCYFALGIAGAPQHLQGVAKCEHVVAVNTDLHAAMIERAGLAVVADAQEVMPALLRLLAAERGGARVGDSTATGTIGSATSMRPVPATAAGSPPPLPSRSVPDVALAAHVLLSAGRHPVSGRGAPVRAEAQATALALALGASVRGLHAGTDAMAVADHFGHGLDAIDCISVGAAADPVPALAAVLAADPPDLVLCGRRGQGGDDSGLVPYALAAELGWPIVADAVALTRDPHEPSLLVVEQALPRGARRRVTVALPAVVTVHPAAPPPRPFAYSPARRGRVAPVDVEAGPALMPALAVEERPWRRRPRLIAGAATSGSAADRLKAATEVAGGGGRLLVDPDPDEAAREILAFLRGIGVVAPQ